MAINKLDFGMTRKGERASLYTLTNPQGTKLTVSDFGAVWVSLFFHDQSGKMRDVVLGYDKLEYYEENPSFFGATVGRNANRIEHAAFVLENETCHLQKNDHDNNLHSGPDLYALRMWEVKRMDEDSNFITFALNSPDGDQGFPGNLHMEVTYQLTDDDCVSVHYHGVCDCDTVVNMTNHSYFNLEGHEQGSAMDHFLKIDAEYMTPVADCNAIPTGELWKVEHTPMDFRTMHRIGERIDCDYDQLVIAGGYDHNYVLRRGDKPLRQAAVLYAPCSEITLEVETDCPGVQFYTGNAISGPMGKNQVPYAPRAGVCLETQYFPNAVNTKSFLSPVLKAGEVYESTTVYHFYVSVL